MANSSTKNLKILNDAYLGLSVAHSDDALYAYIPLAVDWYVVNLISYGHVEAVREVTKYEKLKYSKKIGFLMGRYK